MPSKARCLPTHVRVRSSKGSGLWQESWAKVDDVKSVATERLEEQLGVIGHTTLSEVEEALRLILEL
jgi:mRNA-degrading endonuclease toxin of MazEF toxin-antitoxin module